MNSKTKLSTESYKGVRDFYPEDMFIENYIFDIWRKVCQRFGYVEYNASILEPAELYKAKTGDEIVNEQTYTFKDRGDREVTLRPEMTPTVARMVAARRGELSFPLRWFSIPNLFRYEKPQKGRLREHWQLNVDIFGVADISADIEIIVLADALMKEFGAKQEDYSIRINSRKLMNDFFEHFKLNPVNSYKISKLIDKKNKIPQESFEMAVREIIPESAHEFLRAMSSNDKFLETFDEENKNSLELIELVEKLEGRGVKGVEFDPTLMRGFDYYSGIVFEIYDTNPENPRSIFGGGRYDDLLDIFGVQKVPAFGFGKGDVVIKDFLESRKLIPPYSSSTKIYICLVDRNYTENAIGLSDTLRSEGVAVAVDLSQRKVGDQIKVADKQKIPYVICVGENEAKSDIYTLKKLDSGEEKKLKIEEIVKEVKK